MSRETKDPRAVTMPSLFIPHGGGPCFFMDWTWGPSDTWMKMAAWLRSLASNLPEKPRAILVISAHWEAPAFTVATSPKPEMLFDYYGFPEHTYQLTYPAAGDPALAARVGELLRGAGFETAVDASRGFDHGIFVPFKLAFAEADIPVVPLSLRAGLDPTEHLRAGLALAPLRDEGVLIVGSGMSYHNMRGFGGGRAALAASKEFDQWLENAVTGDAAARDAALRVWDQAPSARLSHPREEHLLPLMVAVGAARGDAGKKIFSDEVMGVRVSAFQFGAAV